MYELDFLTSNMENIENKNYILFFYGKKLAKHNLPIMIIVFAVLSYEKN
jgi:hypothetical protein